MKSIVSLATRTLELAVIAVMSLLVLDVLWGVVTRFILGSPSRWTEEVATFLLIWLSLLGAAVAFARDAHLGVDYLVAMFDPSARMLTRIVAQVVVILFTVAVFILGGFVLVSETLAAGQLTPALGIKMGWVYLAVPLSGIFILLFAVDRIVDLRSANQESTR
jgi:TRAP-type C4-dicarboxylate transport system permease small subunit